MSLYSITNSFEYICAYMYMSVNIFKEMMAIY